MAAAVPGRRRLAGRGLPSQSGTCDTVRIRIGHRGDVVATHHRPLGTHGSGPHLRHSRAAPTELGCLTSGPSSPDEIMVNAPTGPDHRARHHNPTPPRPPPHAPARIAGRPRPVPPPGMRRVHVLWSCHGAGSPVPSPHAAGRTSNTPAHRQHRRHRRGPAPAGSWASAQAAKAGRGASSASACRGAAAAPATGWAEFLGVLGRRHIGSGDRLTRAAGEAPRAATFGTRYEAEGRCVQYPRHGELPALDQGVGAAGAVWNVGVGLVAIIEDPHGRGRQPLVTRAGAERTRFLRAVGDGRHLFPLSPSRLSPG